MKVLHVCAGNLYGGIETSLSTMARLRHLAPAMEPEFGLCFRGRLWDELIATGVPAHDLGPVRLRRPGTVWRARRRLSRVLADSSPQVVITHGSWPHTVFAPAVRMARIRLAHFVHGAMSSSHWLERWASFTAPDLVVANSRFTAASAAGLFPEVPAQVLYLPVPAPEIPDRERVRRRVRQELATSNEAIVILMVSRIEPLKGHSTLLTGLGRMKDELLWVCWVVGGAQRPQEQKLLDVLRRQARSLGIADRVRFVGPRADILAVMVSADIYCQPNSGPEGFGLTFLEALYAGLPVVTSGLGGAVEIVDQNCGLLTKPGDPDAVALALRSLLQDPARRQALGAAGPGRAALLCAPARQLNVAATLLRPIARQA
jgi:glycosyltransferase involved in cell wall biosynthesis